MGLLSEISPITGWPFDPEDVSPSRALAEPSRISFDLAYNSRSAACKHAILMGNIRFGGTSWKVITASKRGGKS